jgi:hypothetical protein
MLYVRKRQPIALDSNTTVHVMPNLSLSETIREVNGQFPRICIPLPRESA